MERRALRVFQVFFLDSVGIPSREEMTRTYGLDYQPGGAWQRITTLQWIRRIRPVLEIGLSVILEGQMRIAFINEGLRVSGIGSAQTILVDCDDDVRSKRLSGEHPQPTGSSWVS
jgi:hypothetical protein